MSVNRTADSIYDLTITSPEDIERALNHSTEVDQKILEVWDPFGRKRFFLEQAPHLLKISAAFTSAYWGTLGFSTCPEIVKGIQSYKELLRHSVAVCNDTLTPLLIESFKAHRTALQCYTMDGQQEAAMAAMAETGTMAQSLQNEYKKLATNFDSFQEKTMLPIIMGEERDSRPVYRKKENWRM